MERVTCPLWGYYFPEFVIGAVVTGKRSEGPWTDDIGRIIPTESRSHKGGW